MKNGQLIPQYERPTKESNLKQYSKAPATANANQLILTDFSRFTDRDDKISFAFTIHNSKCKWWNKR